MHALIIVIFSIILFSIVLFSGISYVNTDYFNIKNQQYKIEADLSNFMSNYSTYESLKGFRLPINNWESDIQEISKYIFNTYEDGSVWNYSSNVNGYYICLYNIEMKERLYKAIKKISIKKESAFLNENCGSDENTEIFLEPTSFPAKAAFTYWISL